MPNNIKGDQEVQAITWEQVRMHALDLALWIRDTSPEKQVTLYGIPRGGTIPAVMIAYMLENEGMNVRLAQALDHLTPNEFRNLIVIDDICDSGDTFKVIQQIAPTARTVTLFHRSTAAFTPNYHSDCLYTNTWLQFPWEC